MTIMDLARENAQRLNTRVRAQGKVNRERERQDEKWGEQNHDDHTWLAILSEEVGELAQAILHQQFGGPAAENLEHELVQVGAVALAWLECIERKKVSP